MDNIHFVLITYVLCNLEGTEATACARLGQKLLLLCFALLNVLCNLVSYDYKADPYKFVYCCKLFHWSICDFVLSRVCLSQRFHSLL